MKECQTFDEGDPLQSASPKVLVFDYIRFVPCVMLMTPLFMQTFDEGDPLQSASPKVLVFDYIRFVPCVMLMTPLFMLIDSFKRKRNC